VSISSFSKVKSIGLLNNPSAPPSIALRLVSGSPSAAIQRALFFGLVVQDADIITLNSRSCAGMFAHSTGHHRVGTGGQCKIGKIFDPV
jgi:hypothetical protein